MPQLLKLVCPRACAPHKEKSLQREAHTLQLESSPCSPQLEKSPRSNKNSAFNCGSSTRAFSGSSAGKKSAYSAGVQFSHSVVSNSSRPRRLQHTRPACVLFPGEGNNYPLQYSGLENSMDCIVHGVAKSQTQLSHCHFDPDSRAQAQ